MSFNNKVDYMPNQSFSGVGSDASDVDHKRIQKRKWQVLIGIFLLVLIIANIFTWSQAPVFQSQSILHFSYKSKTDQGFADLAQQQISLHQQRLKSNSVLSRVSQELEQSQGLIINVQTLFQALSVEASLTGRSISLKAHGNDPQVLKPILDTLSKVYLQLIESETEVNNNTELQVSGEQLEFLEQKIANQKQNLELFALENNITSLERDENRVLSQTKNLGASLDQAVAEQAQAKALLDSLTESFESGQEVIRPDDKSQINATKINLQYISAELTALSEKYTQAYLERDATIVSQQKKAQQLGKQLELQIQTSQLKYIQDTQRDLNTANGKAKQLRTKLVKQVQLAQTFSQKLEQYKRLDNELKALQSQSQNIKNQQVAQEVSKPFEANITLLEPAFIPNFAIGPNYQFNTLLSLLAAVIAGICALLLYSFIVRQKVATAAPHHFVVIPGQADNASPSGLSYAQHGQLSTSTLAGLPTDPLKLSPIAQTLRLLSTDECQALFSVANNQGKALIGLILSGVNIDELLVIEKANFSQHHSTLQIDNQFSRGISIQKELAEAVQIICNNVTDEHTIWTNSKSHEDLVQLLVNIGHDAQIAFPEQLSLDVLRHTYLTYLASQGARLNDIEQVAGYTSPSDLALYRNVNQQGKLLDLEQIQTQYDFVVTS
jgi:succinoglycan biosynthesis transport protein ExoP